MCVIPIHIYTDAHTRSEEEEEEEDGDNERRNFAEQRVECKVKKSANREKERDVDVFGIVIERFCRLSTLHHRWERESTRKKG